MSRETGSAPQLLITRSGLVVSLREAVRSVWNAESEPSEYEVSMTDGVPHSVALLNGTDVEVSNQSPKPLASQPTSKTEV